MSKIIFLFIGLIGLVLAENINEDVESQIQNVSTNPFEALYMSFSMILVSEIGDKTFLLAALMAMKYPKMIVFTASVSALILMTCLSGLLGEILPSILSPKVSQLCAGVLFLVFAISLLREGLSINKDHGVEDEDEVATKEINQMEITTEEYLVNSYDDLEKQEEEEEEEEEEEAKVQGVLEKSKFILKSIITSVWIQIFVMTIVGEWGDRSQISTIAMAAGSEYSMVVIGGSIGHMICSLIAVIGGQLIAKKISMKTVILSGSFTFAIFSAWYIYNGLTTN